MKLSMILGLVGLGLFHYAHPAFLKNLTWPYRIGVVGISMIFGYITLAAGLISVFFKSKVNQWLKK